jgi:hypothetical protein
VSVVRRSLKGLRRSTEAVIDGETRDEPVSPLVGQGRACYSGAKALSFTHP